MKLAHILRVRGSEVALVRLEKGSLRFVFPPELRSAGVLPLTGSAVAARTAATRTPLLSNSFMRVKHVSLFEAVKLGVEVEDRSQEQMPIQKIMSVPVMASGASVMGVVQVSRKGLDPSIAGADFTGEDLKQLEQAAEILARMPFMQEGAEISSPRKKSGFVSGHRFSDDVNSLKSDAPLGAGIGFRFFRGLFSRALESLKMWPLPSGPLNLIGVSPGGGLARLGPVPALLESDL